MNRATHIVASTFGAVMGIAGLEHGIGEALQGNAAPGPMPFQSWPNSEAFKILGGEPAMTILPSMLLAGILTILLSIAVIAWSLTSMRSKWGSPILFLLAIGLLLSGGGYAPPVLGVVTALGALLVHARVGWLHSNVPSFIKQGAARLWGWVFGLCLVLWFYLFPGSIILAALFGLSNSAWIVAVAFPALGFLVLTFVVAFGSDVAHGIVAQAA